LITGFFGRLWHNGVPRDVWLGAGASAAVAAVFAAPLGAALFAQEAISRRFSAYGFAPALACALGAYWVMDTLQGGGPIFTVAAAPALDMDTALIALVVGVVCGLVMSLHILMSAASPMLGKLSGIPLSLRPLLPAVVLFLISPLLPHMLGSGFATLALVFEGGLSLELLVWLIIAKLLLTSLCIGFGFLGDDVIPAMLIGAMLGATVATLLGNAGLGAVAPYAILGAAASLAAVIGAPMAAIVIVLEMTGSYSWAVLAAISVLVATQISRALAARSSFDRQLEMRGVMVNDDHRPRSTWVR
jgi:CIC family chloride channel protein